MKKIILLASLAFSINAFAQVPSYVPTNGLQCWWPFSGNANDGSTNGYNGTVNGATLTTDRFGNNNTAYDFDGVNNSIIIPNINSIMFNNNFTISVWSVFNNFLNSDPYIIGAKNDYLSLHGNGNGYPSQFTNKIMFYTQYAGSNLQPAYTTNLNTNPVFPILNQVQILNWQHIVIVKEIDSISYYLNNILEKKVYYPNQTIINGDSLYIGKGYPNSSSTSSALNGSVDDIGIWNRALTQQEITDLYNGNICYQTITVTDTLLINMGITGFNPVTYNNTIKIFPNPTNDHITIDNGNIANLTGYQIKITNSLSQQVFQSNITQQQFYVDLSTWTGNGIYFVHIIDGQGNTIDIKKIVLQ